MTTVAVPVTEASQVSDARRRATGAAQELGFDATAAGRVAIVVTELATNIVKYGSPGEILIGSFEDETGSGIEVVALDKGGGLANVHDALRDGYSTGGSPGTGLGAIKRQSQAFDIASWPGRGVAIMARIHPSPIAKAAVPRFGSVAVPMWGESVCGDAAAWRTDEEGWTVLVADGLGHGPNAAQASHEAVRLFHACRDTRPGEILAAIHAGMRHTRGGAVSVARYERSRGVLVFTGVGNVAGAIVARGETKRTISLAGTAGHVARRIQEFEYPFSPDGLFVMCSDGIATGWTLDPYPGLSEAHPSLIAGVIYRDFTRTRDDATVLVVRGAGAAT